MPEQDGRPLTTLVSVLVPARDEERWIGRCLDSVLAQTHRDLEVLVADGLSSDATAAIAGEHARQDPRVRLLTNPRRTTASSLNLCLAEAAGDVVVRVDAHSEIPPDYVALALERLGEGRWGGVGGRKDGVGFGAGGRAIAAALGSPFGVGNSVYHYGTARQTVDHVPFGVYPTEVLRSLGGWNEDVASNEDYELDYRLRVAGYELLFDPALRIRWVSKQTLRDLFAQYRRYGRGKSQVARLHPSSIAPRHLAAPALVAMLAAAAALSPRRRRAAAALVAPYA
ncbi:MAG: glycosyltransferase, partial [Actinomycetota bacterium]|nr:glycosyltransferase [Actinomycetota bacterium]